MMQNHNQQKKIALINDFTGFGRCSISVQMPIISMLKVQCCAVPTSIFSNHTAYEDYYFTDYTSNMEAYIEQSGSEVRRNLYWFFGISRTDSDCQ